MAMYRDNLPQLSDDWFLGGAGLETDLMFNHGIEIPQFASHTLLSDPVGREAMAAYHRGFLALARDMDAGFILGSPTWKAHMHWADDLGASEHDLAQANRDAVAFVAGLRREFSDNAKAIVLSASIAPKGDAYALEDLISADDAETYLARQIGWLVDTEADFVAAETFTQSSEAIGVVRTAQAAAMPIVVSFTIETDGNLPTGQLLRDAITAVDDATGSGAAYFMINCAHPDHFSHVLEDDKWSRRIRGIMCNASRRSHAELNESDILDDGDPVELGAQYRVLKGTMPWLNTFGACCGADLRHVTEIAHALAS